MMKKGQKKRSFRSSERGAAMVEFALVLPLLLILVFGIIEFGFYIFNKAVITNASREGARAGVVYTYSVDSVDPDIEYRRISGSDITDTVTGYAEAHLIDFCAEPQALTVTTDPADPRTLPKGAPLTVTATYNYCFLLIPSLDVLFDSNLDYLSNIPITATTVMRAE